MFLQVSMLSFLQSRTSFKPVQLSILWEVWCGNLFQTHLLKLASIEVREGREIGAFWIHERGPPFWSP